MTTEKQTEGQQGMRDDERLAFALAKEYFGDFLRWDIANDCAKAGWRSVLAKARELLVPACDEALAKRTLDEAGRKMELAAAELKGRREAFEEVLSMARATVGKTSVIGRDFLAGWAATKRAACCPGAKAEAPSLPGELRDFSERAANGQEKWAKAQAAEAKPAEHHVPALAVELGAQPETKGAK